MDKPLVIIDGNSLMNRAYYAIQRPMITRDGMYTQGIFGFINMLNKIISDHQPEYISVAFDRKAPTFRHLEYKEYKAGRKKMPPELAMQFPVLKEILEAMKIHMIELDGFEADDIIGTLACEAEKEGLTPLIITGDKDALQLATDVTRIILTRRGITEFEVYDRAAMLEKYGLTPQQFIDLKGLMGDASDNIPGIPGVGEKTATKLLLEYGSVENLIASVDSMKKSKLREKIEENADLAVMSKRLATINTSVPLDIDLPAMKYQEPDNDRLIEIYKRLEFNVFLKKLAASGGKTMTAEFSSEKEKQESRKSEELTDAFSFLFTVSPSAEILRVDSREAADRMQADLWQQPAVWLKVFHDNSHISQPEISSVCLASEKNLYCVFMDGSGTEEKTDWLREFFAQFAGRICGHDIKRDYYALFCAGTGGRTDESQAAASEAAGESDSISAQPAGNGQERRDFAFRTGFDTALAEYVIDPGKSSYELSQLALEYFHEEFPTDKAIMEEISVIDMFGKTEEKQAALALRCLVMTSRLAPVQARRLEMEDLASVYVKVELPLIEVLASMEETGIAVDGQALEEIGASLKEQIEKITSAIHEAAGEEFNINSPKQLGSILFEKMKLPPGKKTKSGYSTNAEVLEKLAEDYEIASQVLEFRMLTKLNGTYVDGMLPLIDSSGKIHAHFQQTVTTTGRLSCTEPNLQNIPVRQELGRMLRKVFTASGEDRILVGADYSQIELRIMAHLSSDPALIEAFEKGLDIHSSTASRVFDVPQEEVTPLQRSRAKAVNFGVIYGISAFGLSSDLKITRAEAQKYIDDYFRKHPMVKDYMERMVDECREQGYVTTMHGRRRRISEISASNYMTRQLGERLAMNTPVQGSAADIMKLAMIETYRRLRKEVPEASVILQVHDELIIDAPKDRAEQVGKILEESMCGASQLNVPLLAEVNTGSDWYSIK